MRLSSLISGSTEKESHHSGVTFHAVFTEENSLFILPLQCLSRLLASLSIGQYISIQFVRKSAKLQRMKLHLPVRTVGQLLQLHAGETEAL